jgi:hypothetical protein
MIPAKINKVYFVDEKTKSFFDNLKDGTSGEQELFVLINRALNDLQENPNRYISVPRRLWPREYIRKYHINNLWKYDLPNGWRLIYTMRNDKVEIMAVIIEWFSHKKYERKFGY